MKYRIFKHKPPKYASSFSLLKRLMRGYRSKLVRESEQSQSLAKVSYNNQVLVLSEDDAQKFVEVMQNPPKPSQELVTLLKARHLKQTMFLMSLLVFLSVDFLSLNVIDKLFSGSLYAESQTTIKVNKAQAKVFFDRALNRSKDDHYGAISDYTEAIRINPQYSNAFLLRGSNKAGLGDYYGAIADFTEAIRLKSDYIPLEKIYRLRGTTKSILGDLNGAISDFTEAIYINPKYSDVYFERGTTKRILGDVYGAISDFTEAIRFNSQSGDAYFNRGLAKLTLGDKKEAFSDFANANVLYYEQGETKKLEKLSQFLLEFSSLRKP
jgi:tetratricopeptide (TPR) repeat protein